LGSLPSFIFLFGDGLIKMTQLQGKKKVKKKNRTWEQPFFLLPEIMPKKRNSKFKIFKKKKWFWSFPIARSEKNNY
jgi:hypothetical protein